MTAFNDGKRTFIGIPVDAGGAGKIVADDKRARLLGKGYKVILNKTSKSKLQRAEPFLVALQSGKVFVAPGVFTDGHYEELENFDGGKCNGYHEDIVDAIADCFSVLTTNMLIPTIRMGTDSARISALGGNTLL
jgi:phage terminase large subunit-like protein